jgi:hypothetical protein
VFQVLPLPPGYALDSTQNFTGKIRLYSDFPTAEYAKYQAGYAFYPDFKCAEFCQFLFNISVCKGFIMKPAEKSICAPTSSMVAHSRAG